MSLVTAVPTAQILPLSALVLSPVVDLSGEEITIGRADHCTVVVRHPLASRLHARIGIQGGRYVLEDAGSVNGTFLNGQRIHSTQMLRPGDTIGIADPAPLLRFTDPDGTRARPDILRFDLEQQLFFFHDRIVQLSQSEFKLLLHLRANTGRVCTRESCVYAVWHARTGTDAYRGALDQLVYQIRAKLLTIDSRTDLIKTVRGEGYLLEL